MPGAAWVSLFRNLFDVLISPFASYVDTGKIHSLGFFVYLFHLGFG